MFVCYWSTHQCIFLKGNGSMASLQAWLSHSLGCDGPCSQCCRAVEEGRKDLEVAPNSHPFSAKKVAGSSSP